MKYLNDYIEEKQSALFKRLGTFFAFSTTQFKEQAQRNVKYVNMGMGMLTPDDTVEELINGLHQIYEDGRAQDITENGKDAIIRRELSNHEAYYTGDVSSTAEALAGYSIKLGEIVDVYNREAKEQNL